MNIDKTDIELYLKRQNASSGLKFSRFMEVLANYIVPPTIFYLFFYMIMMFCFYTDQSATDASYMVMTVASCIAGAVFILLTILELFLNGLLPRFNALLTVIQIKNLYVSTGEVYNKLNYLTTDERPAIDYLNSIVAAGILMDVKHSRRVYAMLEHAKKQVVLKDECDNMAAEIASATSNITPHIGNSNAD